MSQTKLNVNLEERSYEIQIVSHGVSELPGLLEEWVSQRSYWKQSRPKGLIVCDVNVTGYAQQIMDCLQAAGWSIAMLTVPSGEKTKSIEHVSRIYSQLVAMIADRKTTVFAVGGGVVGDLAGFAAATYARGLPFVQIPTTLLSDVDSSVGGKVGINLPEGKNLVGAFHQPLGVLIETDFLLTLPDREYRSGLAEVVKYGVIMDESFFDYLEQHTNALRQRDPDVLREVIRRSCQCKADVVEEDEYERTGRRAILNYGHTFAHAYEALCGYGTLLHGEAVSIGMIDASILAEKLGRISSDTTTRQIHLLEKLDLPIAIPEEIQPGPAEMIDVMLRDKKTVGGELRFVLPTRLGHVETVGGVSTEMVQDVLTRNML